MPIVVMGPDSYSAAFEGPDRSWPGSDEGHGDGPGTDGPDSEPRNDEHGRDRSDKGGVASTSSSGVQPGPWSRADLCYWHDQSCWVSAALVLLHGMWPNVILDSLHTSVKEALLMPSCKDQHEGVREHLLHTWNRDNWQAEKGQHKSAAVAFKDLL